jgi:hypothetical protein
MLARRSYAEIEDVDARQWLGTQSLILRWRGRLLAFSANLGAAAPLPVLLAFFEARGNKLTPRAREILAVSRRL